MVDLERAPDIPVVTSVEDAPVMFADILYHVTWLNGVARLSFVQNNSDVPIDGTPAFVGRHVVTVAMPMGAVVGMRDYLSSIISMWEEAVGESGQTKE